MIRQNFQNKFRRVVTFYNDLSLIVSKISRNQLFVAVSQNPGGKNSLYGIVLSFHERDMLLIQSMITAQRLTSRRIRRFRWIESVSFGFETKTGNMSSFRN